MPPISREDLIAETMITAGRLSREGDKANTGRALELACRLGWKGPESKNWCLTMLAVIPSSFLRRALFRVQMHFRGGVAPASR